LLNYLEEIYGKTFTLWNDFEKKTFSITSIVPSFNARNQILPLGRA
jgi:hypothetical protein